MSGKVWLVGAGPGDLGLLTIKGLDIIKSADVVIYDRLVGEDILKLIPKNAEKIDAGKKSAEHKIPQENINKILLEKAIQGKNVVRLKGGDCFLFGRGGEELELLKDNNVDFEVVPGITSALAVPAYGGIPVTHRDFSSSVHIITGHQKQNTPLSINFKSLAKCGGTLVFLMGVENLGNITKGLMNEGMRKDMPCAVIEQGTTPEQRKIISTINNVKSMCEKENIKSPAVIVVGEVCALSDKLDWFDKLPLKGKTIIVTRPKGRDETLSKKLKALGAKVIECPCIETISLIDDLIFNEILDKIKTFDCVAFTSPFGVKIVFEKLFEKNFDGRIFGNKKIAAIGSATNAQLKKYGLSADFVPKTYDGKSLGALLGKTLKNDSVLLLRAKEGSAEITKELTKAKIKFEDKTIYYTKYVNSIDNEIKQKIVNGKIDFITFTSQSTVKAFSSIIKYGYDKFIGVCIGEKTNKEALKYGISTIVSKKASVCDMISSIILEVKKCR